MSLLILALVVFILWPLIRTAFAIYRLRKGAKQAFRQAQRQAEEQQRYNRPGGWSGTQQSTQRPKKKKITSDQGEYIDWEEIPSSPDSTPHSSTSFASEQQIVDAEWEDIKQ